MKHSSKGEKKFKHFKGKKKKGKIGKVKHEPGKFLTKPVWDSIKLAPINKNFYKPSANTQRLTTAEVEKFRETNNITVIGNDVPPCLSFKDANFKAETASTLLKLGFEKPTPIQAQGWPIALRGLNLVGIAETGSGKTLAFLLPAISHISHQKPLKAGDGPIALVLAPTRELALQIKSVADQFNIKAVAVYGGASKDKQIAALNDLVELIVGTPGRLLDVLQRGATNLKRTSFVVLDEADRMLDMGFEDQIRSTLNQIRPDRQLLMWSATWPESVKKLAEDFLGEYVQILIGNKDLAANHNIKQIVEICAEFEKQDRLIELLRNLKSSGGLKTLIFANTKRLVDFICRLIRKNDFSVGSIHGDKVQSKRNYILQKFSEGKVEILIATDVASRGIDVSDIKHVINYDFPLNTEDYVHRIGRTGRQQKKGVAYTFFGQKNHKQAESLINILEEAKQTVTPELRALVSHTVSALANNLKKEFTFSTVWLFHPAGETPIPTGELVVTKQLVCFISGWLLLHLDEMS